MADVSEETNTTTTGTAATATRVDGTPQVEVYDTDRKVTSGATTSPAYTTTRTDLEPAGKGMNWGAIIIGILIVVALVLLFMWLF